MKDNVFISVIIPTYKRNNSICKAIESVLIQNINCEVIVVDDNDLNSKYYKKNQEILSKYKKIKNFKYIEHKKNKNGASARNTGIKVSKGKYITFLDDDDEFCENRLVKIKECLEKEDYDFLYTGVILKKDGIIQKVIKPIDIINKDDLIYKLLCIDSFFITGSNLICKKKIIDKINGFDESFVRNQDIEFTIRYLEECKKIGYINDLLVIKNIDSRINVPNYNDMKKVKTKLLSKFNYILNNYDEDKKKIVISNNLYELYRVSIISKENKKAIKLLKKYNVYSLKKVIKNYLKVKLRKSKNITFLRNLLYNSHK